MSFSARTLATSIAALSAGILMLPAAALFVAPVVAQGVLAQLGLSDAQARAFLFEEMKQQGPGHRRTPIAVTGHRAFYKLPPAARGPAATALFAWAKAYVNSPAFRTAYAQFRREANPVDTRPRTSVDQQVADELARSLESLEAFKQTAASLAPREVLGLLAAVPLAVRATAKGASQLQASAQHRVALSGGHGLLLGGDGTVHLWHVGRLGEGNDAVLARDGSRPLPAYTLAPVDGLTDIVAVAASSARSFAVRANGTVLAWGMNGGNGQLGTTPLSFFETRASWGPDSHVPTPLAVPFDAVDVSSHENHTLALTRDGHVYAWGTGDKGQLGIGPMPVIRFRTNTPAATRYLPFPAEVRGLSGVTAISAGYAHSLALLRDGTVMAWGENRWGEVGDGTTVTRESPVAVPGVRAAVAIAAGNGFSAAVLGDGTVMTWGNRFEGALGRAPHDDNLAEPTPGLVPGVNRVRTIVAGSVHVLALTDAGTIISWGQPDFGALGRGDATVRTPVPIPRLAGVQSVAARGYTSMAVLASGRIMTWGSVRPWTRPPEEGSYDDISRLPILLWLDGLAQP